MGQITRPTKGGGTTEYTTEVLAVPNKKIIAAEVDADLDRLYTTINSLDHANLSASAGILGSQLDPNAAILGTQLANTTVGTGQLTDLNVTLGKLAIGAGVHTFASGVGVAGLNFSTTETTLVTLSSMTVRGGFVVVFGTLGLVVSSAVIAGSALLRLKRNGTLIAGWNYIIAPGTGLATDVLQVPVPSPVWLEQPSAGAVVYTLTGTTSNTNTFFKSDPAFPGQYFAVEFA